MIESLTIIDFQIHRKRTIDLAHPVIVLAGDSGTGKSGIIRCLRWLMTNRPTGDSFVRKGASECKAILTVDGKKVTRAKGKGVNRYRFSGEDFKALGAGGVPEPIAKHLNVSDASFQTQHAGPFLFDLTPGQVSQALNEVVNLSEIDDCLAAVGSELRKARAAVGVGEDRLAEAEAKAKSLEWVGDADVDLKRLEEAEEKLESLRLRSRRLADLVREGEKLRERAENAAEDVQAMENAIIKLSEVRDRAESARERAGTLERLIESIESVDEKLADVRKEADAAEKALAKLTEKSCPLCGR